MSKSVHYRLPDKLYEDLVAYAKKEGVSVTDVVIEGIRSVIHDGEMVKGEVVCVVEKEPPTIDKKLEKAIERKVAFGEFFRPMPKKGKK